MGYRNLHSPTERPMPRPIKIPDPVRAAPKRKEPLWKGPTVDGVTFSMLNRFLTCRARFYAYAVEGWRPADQFNHRLEFGQMWHVCEEWFAKRDTGNPSALTNGPRVPPSEWLKQLTEYARNLCTKYPLDREQIDKWYRVIKDQFPIYIEYWSKHPDVTSRKPLFQEQVFDVPYVIPSGRKVRLRGKIDGADVVGKDKEAGVFVQENKTKSEIDQAGIARQLTYDLQTNIYLTALHHLNLHDDEGRALPIRKLRYGYPIRGVRYNVIRRPLSGGKGDIRQKKGSKNIPPEGKAEFHARLAGIIRDSPADYFARWKVEVLEVDVHRFRRECLDPILEQLCDWYECVSSCFRASRSPFEMVESGKQAIVGTPGGGRFVSHGIHWRHPFGCTNVLDEYGHTEYDEYVTNGSTVGLTRAETLFRELEV